jgi:hypothetical protein
MKKLLATILALVMTLGLCTSAWATEKSIGSETELKNAINSVNDGDVIKLSADVTISEKVTISKNIFLDLGTHTLTSAFAPTAEDYALVAEGNVTIQNGSIVTTKDKARAVNNSKGNLNLENVIITAKGQVGVGNSATSGNVSIKNCKINSETAYAVASFAKNANVVMDINKSEMSGAYGAFYHNGTASGLTLSVTETTMSSENGDGMYLAGDAVTTLSNCTITGATGVEIRAGKLTVNGGSITGTATPIGAAPNGNGSTVTGAGIAVSQHTTMLPLTVTVNGSNVKGYSAFYQVDTLAEMEDNAGNKQFTGEQVAEAVAKITLSVNGGVYTATGEDGKAVYSENKTGFVSGGTFSNSVDPTYLADGLKYEVCAGGKYSYYSDFDTAAAAAAADGHEVIKVGNSGTGVVPFHINYDDGTGVKPALRMSKDNFELPTPTRSGYTFKGWKVLDCEGTQVLFAGPLSSEEVKSKIFAETAAGDGGAEVRADYSDGVTLIAVWSSNSYYYYPSTSDTTTSTTTKGSPKTFDAGAGIYAVTALLSVTGMAWTAKKRH